MMNLQQEYAAGSKHPTDFVDGASVVHVRQGQATIHQVKAAGRERQRFGPAVDESDSRSWRVRRVKIMAHATGLVCRIEPNSECAPEDNERVKHLPYPTTNV